MIFRVRHLTTYHYGEPVVLSHHAAHLQPRDSPGQRHHSATLEVAPAPEVMKEGQLDYFGNPVTFFTIQESHDTLEVEAGFVVETAPAQLLPQSGGPTWERVRADLAEPSGAEAEAALDFLFPSAQVPLIRAAAEFAEPSFVAGRPLCEAALDLSRRIHGEFAFDPVATLVGTPLAEVFKERRGVCQDFAHVGIACFRAMGLAARYVSGYIRTHAPPGKEKLVGADASHAWLAVFVPGWGWMDLDPTNDCAAGEDHIVVAWGRDYDDVSPIKGVVLGGGDHRVEVAVDVTEIG